jgi:hypothetical protein
MGRLEDGYPKLPARPPTSREGATAHLATQGEGSQGTIDPLEAYAAYSAEPGRVSLAEKILHPTANRRSFFVAVRSEGEGSEFSLQLY